MVARHRPQGLRRPQRTVEDAGPYKTPSFSFLKESKGLTVGGKSGIISDRKPLVKRDAVTSARWIYESSAAAGWPWAALCAGVRWCTALPCGAGRFC